MMTSEKGLFQAEGRMSGKVFGQELDLFEEQQEGDVAGSEWTSGR